MAMGENNKALLSVGNHFDKIWEVVAQPLQSRRVAVCIFVLEISCL